VPVEFSYNSMLVSLSAGVVDTCAISYTMGMLCWGMISRVRGGNNGEFKKIFEIVRPYIVSLG